MAITLLSDGWQLELHAMFCACGQPGCPRFVWQVLALSPAMLFEDRTEAIAEVLAANGEIMHEQHPTLQ